MCVWPERCSLYHTEEDLDGFAVVLGGGAHVPFELGAHAAAAISVGIEGIELDCFLEAAPCLVGFPLAGEGEGQVDYRRGVRVVQGNGLYQDFQGFVDAVFLEEHFAETAQGGDVLGIGRDGFTEKLFRFREIFLGGLVQQEVAQEDPGRGEIGVGLDGVLELADGLLAIPLGEEVAAAIYLTQVGSVDTEGLRAYLRETLSSYKIPRYIWLVDAPLPRNANGKFVKREVRDLLDLADAQ